MTPKTRFGLVVAPLAFSSFISFVQTSQYIAEKTGTALWWGLGILFAALAIWQLAVVIKQSDHGMPDK